MRLSFFMEPLSSRRSWSANFLRPQQGQSVLTAIQDRLVKSATAEVPDFGGIFGCILRVFHSLGSFLSNLFNEEITRREEIFKAELANEIIEKVFEIFLRLRYLSSLHESGGSATERQMA